MAEDHPAPPPSASPAPAAAGPLRLALEGFWRRLVAAFLDWVLIGILAAAVGDLLGVEAPSPSARSLSAASSVEWSGHLRGRSEATGIVSSERAPRVRLGNGPGVLGARSLDDRRSLDIELPEAQLRPFPGSCCVEKRAVASDHDDAADPCSDHRLGRQPRAGPRHSRAIDQLSQLASAASEGVIDFDDVDLLAYGVEPSGSVAQLPSREASKSLRLSESRACLRIASAGR